MSWTRSHLDPDADPVTDPPRPSLRPKKWLEVTRGWRPALISPREVGRDCCNPEKLLRLWSTLSNDLDTILTIPSAYQALSTQSPPHCLFEDQPPKSHAARNHQYPTNHHYPIPPSWIPSL